MHHFEYDEYSRLLLDRNEDGTELVYKVAYHEEGPSAQIGISEIGQPDRTINYDRRFRPVRLSSKSGKKTKWQYNEDRSVEIDTKMPNGKEYRVKRIRNNRSETIKVNNRITY